MIAYSDPKPHAPDFENSGETQTNDNFDAASTKDSPIISVKHLPMNQQSSGVAKGTPPKPSKRKAKIGANECRKRVLEEALGKEGEWRLLHPSQIELIVTSCSRLHFF
jgi:hypothetical protein